MHLSYFPCRDLERLTSSLAERCESCLELLSCLFDLSSFLLRLVFERTLLLFGRDPDPPEPFVDIRAIKNEMCANLQFLLTY